MSYYDDVLDLRVTLNHMGTCMKGVKVIPTKNGCQMKKGNRSIDVNLSYENNTKALIQDSLKIRRNNNGYYMKVNRRDRRLYNELQQSIIRALGIKD